MFKAVFNRDFVLNSLKGYCVHFKKDVPHPIPNSLREEVIDNGGVVSGDEEMIAKQKVKDAERANLEAAAATERAKAAAAEKELAEMKRKQAAEEKAKSAALLEKEKLKEAAKTKIKQQQVEKEAAKELAEEENSK